MGMVQLVEKIQRKSSVVPQPDMQELFDQSIAGNGGKVWSTLHQFGVLYKHVKNKGKPSFFVSHVSPGKEPLLVRLMMHFMPNFWISGHMGAPFTCIWNQFTIHEMNESMNWLQTDIDFIEAQYQHGYLSEEALLAYVHLRLFGYTRNFKHQTISPE